MARYPKKAKYKIDELCDKFAFGAGYKRTE